MKRFKRSSAATDLLEPTLVWQQPDGTTVDVRIPLARAITIGRDAENTLAIDSSFVSKTHASVRLTDGQCIIEDLQSANGTRVNGQPVATFVLTPGDVIDLGDHSLTFVDRAARGRSARRTGSGQSKAQPAPAAKLLRLALAAVITGGVMLAAFRLLLPGETPTTASATSRAAVTTVSPEQVRRLARFINADSVRVREVAAAATQAGVAPADALFDEGEIHRRAGRFLQAAHLFAAALKAQPDHPTARARLDRSLVELERAVTELLAEADRHAGELRWAEAMATWGRVVAALPAGDPRVARARASREEARRRVARPDAFE